MARYKYHEDWEISYSHDCSFWIRCRTIKDAVWIASMRGDHSMITVHADAQYGDKKRVVHVGFTMKEARGLTPDEIFALLDRRVDQYFEAIKNVSVPDDEQQQAAKR